MNLKRVQTTNEEQVKHLEDFLVPRAGFFSVLDATITQELNEFIAAVL